MSVFLALSLFLSASSASGSAPDTANAILLEKLRTHDAEITGLRNDLARLDRERRADVQDTSKLQAQLRGLKGVDSVLTKERVEEPKLQRYIQAAEKKLVQVKKEGTSASEHLKLEEADERKVDRLWRESESLQHQNLALRASKGEASEAVNSAEARKLGVEANRSSLATTAQKKTAQLATLLANTTHLREEVALLVRQRQTLKLRAKSLEALRPKLKEEDAEVAKLSSQVRTLHSRLTQARASLLFGHSVQLRKQASAARRENKELWAKQQHLDREILRGQAELQAAKAKVAQLKRSLKHAQASAPFAAKRVTRLRAVDRKLTAEHQSLVQNITLLQAKLRTAEQEHGELSHELDDLGPSPSALAALPSTGIAPAVVDSPVLGQNVSAANGEARKEQTVQARNSKAGVVTTANVSQAAGVKNVSVGIVSSLDDTNSDDDDEDEDEGSDADADADAALPLASTAPGASSPDLAALAAAQGMAGSGTRLDLPRPLGRLWLPRNTTAATHK